MSVHEALRTLVTRYGDRVLDAADDLRATLDDFLEEGQATPGEINLLVDAVRLGAYQQMISALTHGADPRAAVEASGARLAEERGGDHRSASWACAALGYAIGQVPEAVVLSYRSQQPGGGLSAPMTGAPPMTGQPMTGQPPTGTPSYGQDYGTEGPQQTAPVGGYGQPPVPQQPAQTYGAGSPQPTQAPAQAAGAAAYGQSGTPWSGTPGGSGAPSGSGGNRRNLFIGIGAAVAAAAVIAVVAVVATGGDDPQDPQADDTATSESTDTTDTTGPTEPTDTATTAGGEFDPAFEVSALATTYGALGSKLGADAESCERIEPQEGQSELVSCTYSQLEVMYTTYTDEAALEDARAGIAQEVASENHQLESAEISDAGQFHLASDTDLDVTWMYWDSTQALQSAYVSDKIAELPSRAANTFFDQRGAADATRVFPEPVAPFQSPALWEMAQDYVGDQVSGNKVKDCDPSKTYEGDVEAVICTDGDYTVFFYVREDFAALKSDRKSLDDPVEDTTWNWFGDGDASFPTSGRLIKSTITPEGGSEQAVVYWDDEALLINGFIYGPNAKIPPATAYWANGE